MGFPGVSVVKNLPASVGDTRDMGSIPGWGRFPGGGNGNLLQCSCLENAINREAWWATVHSVTEMDTTEAIKLGGLESVLECCLIFWVIHVQNSKDSICKFQIVIYKNFS